jgi:YggT family protein
MQYLLIQIVDKFFLVYMLMLFARIIASWFPELRDNRLVQFIGFCTDPYLNFFRNFIPPMGMFDFSPIVAFLCLGVIEQLVKLGIVVLFR